MRLKLFFLIILLISSSVHVKAEKTLRSELTEEGAFCNRLRFSNDNSRFSLISEFKPYSEDRRLSLEPSLRTPFFSAGRLNYSGLITELFNPDNLRSSSSSLIENTALKTDDSFSAGPRLGFFSELPYLSTWIFRNKEDFISAGTAFSGICSGFPEHGEISAGLSGNFILTAINMDEDSACWFSENPLTPSQMCMNTSAEMRLVSGGIHHADRRQQATPEKENNRIVCGIFSAFSMPQYTASGWLLRGSLTLGRKDGLLRMMAMHCSSDYMTPAGDIPDYTNIAGVQIHGGGSLSKLNTAADIEYLYRQNRPLPLYSRRIGQSNEIKAGLKADFSILELSSALKYSITELPNTNKDESFSADTVIQVEPGLFSFKVFPGVEIVSSSIIPEYTYSIGTVVSFKIDSNKAELTYKYADMQHETKISLNICHDNNHMILKISSLNMTEFKWSAAVDILSEQ